MIKILAISASPRKERNTEKLIEAVLEGCLSAGKIIADLEKDRASEKASLNGSDLQEEAFHHKTDLHGEAEPLVETRLMRVSDAKAENFKLCRGCWACAKTGRCVCGDDYISEIYRQISLADGIILGTPVFFFDVTAQCKAIIDRSLAYTPAGTGKAAAAVVTAGSVGITGALQTLQSFFSAHGFTDTGWTATYGKTDDKIKGKETAASLGRKLVCTAWMLKNTGYTEEFLKAMVHTNHFAYGTHTF